MMALNYQRKVDEFDVLLSDYCKDQSLIEA